MSDSERARRSLTAEELKHPFLEGFSPAHLRVLADCAMRVEFAEGEVIFREGDPANRFFCILEGQVEIRAAGGAAGPVVVHVVGAGEVLGWSWMCFPYVWAFEAVARARTKAIFFYATRLREDCEEDPGLGYAVMKRVAEVMMKRLQAARVSLLKQRVS